MRTALGNPRSMRKAASRSLSDHGEAGPTGALLLRYAPLEAAAPASESTIAATVRTSSLAAGG